MNRKINILWIEDEDKATIKELQDEVKAFIEKAYYDVQIFNVKNEQAAKKELKIQHIDLIFSDNNLSNNEEGIDFLTEYRSNSNYKYYILYSSLNESDIITKISSKLEEKAQIHLFSNFDFISLNNWHERIDEALEAFLNNRNKIEELKSMYIVENAIIEERLKTILKLDESYQKLIDAYTKKFAVNKKTRNLWHKVRMDRNILAHGVREFKNGYNIIKNDKKKISEQDFGTKINQLKQLNDELKNINFF